MINIKNEEEFKKIIKEDKVLVDFYADWCGPCKIMKEVLKEIENDIKIVKVNVDNFENLAMEYKVMTIPTLILFKQGKIIKENSGIIKKEELKEFISK